MGSSANIPRVFFGLGTGTTTYSNQTLTPQDYYADVFLFNGGGGLRVNAPGSRFFARTKITITANTVLDADGAPAGTSTGGTVPSNGTLGVGTDGGNGGTNNGNAGQSFPNGTSRGFGGQGGTAGDGVGGGLGGGTGLDAGGLFHTNLNLITCLNGFCFSTGTFNQIGGGSGGGGGGGDNAGHAGGGGGAGGGAILIAAPVIEIDGILRSLGGNGDEGNPVGGAIGGGGGGGGGLVILLYNELILGGSGVISVNGGIGGAGANGGAVGANGAVGHVYHFNGLSDQLGPVI